MMKALLSLFMLLVFMLAVVDSVIRSGQSFHFLIGTINLRNFERTFIDSHLETTNKRLDSMLDYAMIELPQVWVSLFFGRVVLHTHCKINTGLLFSREKK